jgi:hypothetical protein
MNDYRAAGQELQGQVMAAARKGQQRVTSTVKNVTSAAQQIRPQLAGLPKPSLSLTSLPGQAQLREKAPELASKLQSRLPDTLQSRLPSPDQVKAGAQQLAGHARSVQRTVVGQFRSAAMPLAHQAATRLAQVGVPTGAGKAAADGKTTTKVTGVTVAKSGTTRSAKATDRSTAAKDGGSAKARTRQGSTSPTSPSKPKDKPADK